MYGVSYGLGVERSDDTRSEGVADEEFEAVGTDVSYGARSGIRPGPVPRRPGGSSVQGRAVQTDSNHSPDSDAQPDPYADIHATTDGDSHRNRYPLTDRDCISNGERNGHSLPDGIRDYYSISNAITDSRTGHDLHVPVVPRRPD